MTMPSAPIRIDKPLRRGSELRIRWYVTKPSGAPQDITGATFICTVRTGEGKDTPVVLTPTQTVVSLAGGIIDFSLTETQTQALIAGLDYWISGYVNHATFTAGTDRIEFLGRLDLVA